MVVGGVIAAGFVASILAIGGAALTQGGARPAGSSSTSIANTPGLGVVDLDGNHVGYVLDEPSSFTKSRI
jgi:hypothetical protein